ncbi:MAG TPA: hypothetical protein VFQ76_06395, partial [Longimicrobiaceae bacterium]|nr:hypothetical protein [Longimicrobiaceae bacterium]
GELSWDYAKSEPVQHPFEIGGVKATMQEALANEQPPVVAIDTPMGRVAVVICKDFLESEIRRRLELLRATVVVVLSMTGIRSVDEFKALRSFGPRNAAVSLFCNSSILYRRERPTIQANPHWTPRWELGIVYSNTRTGLGKEAYHALPAQEPEAVVGMYRLHATAGGLKVTCRCRTWPQDAAECAGG